MASFKNLISNTSAQIASGGTITGDLVINGDLQVDGGGSLSFDEIVQGTQVIDVTNTEALLVRKNDDGGDVFIVDTTNSRVGIGVIPTHNLNVYNGSGSSGMTVGKYASGKTVALLGTSADTSGYFQIQSYASQGSTFGNIALNAQGGNVGIGRSTNIDKKLHILSSTSGDGITLEQSSVGSNAIRFEANSSALRGLFGSEDSDGGAILSGTSGYSMVLRSESDIFLATNGNNEALKIDTSQNATFAGNVKITKAESSASEFISALEINRDYGSATGTDLLTGMIFTDDNSVQAGIFTNRYNSAGSYNSRLQFYVNNSSSSMTPQTALGDPALIIDESKNATFAGAIKQFRDDSSTVGTNDVVIENDGSGDASLKFSLTGATDWYAYVDNSDSDKFKIRRSTTDHFTIDESGNATFTGDIVNSSTSKVIKSFRRLWMDGNNDFGINNASGDSVVLITGGATPATSTSAFIGNATFAGNVGIGIADGAVTGYGSGYTEVGIGGFGTNNRYGALNISGRQDSTAGTIGDINFSNINSSGTVQSRSIIRAYIDGHTTASGLKFYTEPNGGASSQALQLDSSNNATFAGDVTVSSATDEKPSLVIESTNAGANGGELKFFKNTTDEADGDDLGNIRFNGINSAGTQVGYIQIKAEAVDVSDNSEDGKLSFSISGNNVNANRFVLDGNSRISLSNNDSGTSNTVFGKLAGDDLASGGNYNSLFGESAGHAITTGDGNVIMGHTAGQALTTGVRNVLLGRGAGLVTTNAEHLTGIGFYSLSSVNSADASGAVAVGYQALKALTSGASNTAIGYQSAQTLTTGASNVSIGYQAMGNANLGSDKNVMIGKSAFFNGEVDEAVFIGFNAGGDGTTTTGANGTVGIGKSVLNALTSGARNTAVGYQSLMTEDTGSYHTSLGYQALKVVDAPNGHNTGLGHKAGVAISSGSSNTVVGSSVAEALTTGTNNTIVGASANVNSGSSTNRISIGQGTVATEDNSIFIGNSSAHTLYIGKGRTTTQNIRFNDASEAGMIQYDHSNQMLRITVEGTEHSRFGSGGDLVLLHGGVNFLDAEGSSASSDANTLDDYEEGDWTPTYACSSGSFNTLTMDVVSATYTKIGRQVTVRGAFRTDNVNLTGASGTLKIAGLPFTSVATHGESPVVIGHVYSWVSNNFPYSGYVLSNTTEILLVQRDTSNGATSSMAPSDLTAGATGDQNGMTMMVTYFV